MNKILSHIQFTLHESLCVKNPMTSEVGHEILKTSCQLIAQDGIDQFNFKKLAIEIGSTESTIYRYFTNKHQLLMYLSSWYWSILEMRLVFMTTNLRDPLEKLHKTIEFLSLPDQEKPEPSLLPEKELNLIVVRDAFKSFNALSVDKSTRKHYYKAYSELAHRIADIIHKANMRYKFPLALASTLIETAHHQHYLLQELEELTDLGHQPRQLQKLLHQIAFTALEEKI